MTTANRPNRIGKDGVTMQWSVREVDKVTLAAIAQARHDGTTLSQIVRGAVRDYLEDREWNVFELINGDQSEVDAQWLARLNRVPPKTRARAKRTDPIDAGGTLEMW